MYASYCTHIAFLYVAHRIDFQHAWLGTKIPRAVNPRACVNAVLCVFFSFSQKMVKEVISLDTQYWVLLELPRQEKQEQVNAYVLRACATLEKASESRTQDASARAAAEEALRDRKQRLDGMSVQEIEDENSQSINDLYRLLKKYGNLRSIVHSLQVAYTDSKVYPFVPRYSMLKDMIKCVLREPGYMEVCHEDISRT